MENTKASIVSASEITTIHTDVEQARYYAKNARAKSTRQRYRQAMQGFMQWCELNNRETLPATGDTIAAFAASLASSNKPSTISLKISSIAAAHKLAGHEFDRRAVSLVLSGIMREKGSVPRKVAALKTKAIREIIGMMKNTPIEMRDKAILLLGFAGALRASEISGLDISREQAEGSTGFIDFDERGLKITLTRSKTDQEGRGQEVAVPYGQTALCPVRAVQAWLEVGTRASGALFEVIRKGGNLTGKRLDRFAVRRIVKRRAEAAGVASTDGNAVSAHSLRAGFCTDAAAAGCSIAEIQRQSRHRSVDVLMGYVREAEMFENNALNKMGL